MTTTAWRRPSHKLACPIQAYMSPQSVKTALGRATVTAGRIGLSPGRSMNTAQLGRRASGRLERGRQGESFRRWEQPELFATEVRTAFRPLRQALENHGASLDQRPFLTLRSELAFASGEIKMTATCWPTRRSLLVGQRRSVPSDCLKGSLSGRPQRARSAPSAQTFQTRSSRIFVGASRRRGGRIERRSMTGRRAYSSQNCRSWFATGEPITTGARQRRS